MATPPQTEDAAVLVWSGYIPTVFSMAAAEVTTLQAPPQYHVCIPRQSLLPFVTKEVHEHFLSYAPPLSNEMWVEHNGDPLRWQLPAGVLFDLLVGEESSENLPWCLTVRFQGFPAETLLRASPEAAEGVLLNALKESCFLSCGSALPAMSLSSDAQQQLALAVTASDYTTFAKARCRSYPCPPPSSCLPACTLAQ